MVDGKPYKTLKRHLATNGLTPADYRARYKLPDDYPMVAPAYSEARRETARRLELGRKPATAAPAGETAAPATAEAGPNARARRGAGVDAKPKPAKAPPTAKRGGWRTPAPPAS